MPPRRPARTAPLLLGASVLGLLAVACGGRVELDVPDCNADAVAYCSASGCPLTGPTAATPSAVTTWCVGSTAFASRVNGYGTCTTPGGQPWATEVRATDASGALLYLLYDPSSGSLLSVSTVPITAATDGGTGEKDYGTCGAHTGIVTCATTTFSCAR
jgi:hypothetical protein